MLHPNDPGYVSFYNDVLTEISTIRHGYKINNSIPSEHIVEQFEFWIEEDFFSPEFSDDVLYQSTALRILDLFENSVENDADMEAQDYDIFGENKI